MAVGQNITKEAVLVELTRWINTKQLEGVESMEANQKRLIMSK